METTLFWVSEKTILLLQAIALSFVLLATLLLLRDVAGLLRRQLTGEAPDPDLVQRIWLDYARWLVAALTVQLGADIVESAAAPSWEGIARLGAIAAIRTFLNFFLARDLHELRQRH